MRNSPYLGGKADIVRDFLASCRRHGVSPCLYFIPAEDGAEEKSGDSAAVYLETQLAMLRELLTRYGPIDRIWFDFWGDACGMFGAGCPKGSFTRSKGYDNVTALVRELAPHTVMVPGPDGCLDDAAVENGEGVYPSWNYRSPQGNPGNPVVCSQVLPASPGAIYAAHEVDQTIMNPGDHWFWDASHPYLGAAALWQYWLDTVGRGSSWILNVPPDRTGSIPHNFSASVAQLGAALNSSFFDAGSAAASAGQSAAATCAKASVVVQVPPGRTVDAVWMEEDMAGGQSVAAYVLEQRVHGNGSAGWTQVLAGQTVGSQLVDLLDSPLVGPAALRWRCTASSPADATSVRLATLSATKLQPPAGWVRPRTTAWVLQTLYSSTAEDMTPCATRDHVSATGRGGAAAANRSACTAYMHKPGANYTYVRDEHCCLAVPAGDEASVPPGAIPLYLLYAAAFNDHMLSPNRSYSFGGQRYGTYGPECYGYPSNATHPSLAPLDLYWSEERNDTWALATDASRAQALTLGYVAVAWNVARVPTAC